MGKELYLGEVLGKHSQVTLEINSSNLKSVSLCEKCVEQLRKSTGFSVSGIYPFDYLEE